MRLTRVGSRASSVLERGDGDVAVSVRNVTKTFVTDGQPYTAVSGVSFDARLGEFVAIVGPSGCGKSTILGMVSGLQPANAGSVDIFGESLTGLNPHTSYMFQQDALLPWKSVLDNVILGLTFRGYRHEESRALGLEWLERVGLGKFTDRYPHQLSGGMRRRATIAQTWIVDPSVLLMDEPFSALDVHNRQMMGSELLNLWQGSNKCVLFVTHDLEEAISLSDRVVVMSAGPSSRVVGDFAVDIPRPRDLMEIRLDRDFIELYDKIWGALRGEVLKSQQSAREIDG